MLALLQSKNFEMGKGKQKRNANLEVEEAFEEVDVVLPNGTRVEVGDGVGGKMMVPAHNSDLGVGKLRFKPGSKPTVNAGQLISVKQRVKEENFSRGLVLGMEAATAQKKKPKKAAFKAHPVALYVMCPMNPEMNVIPRFDQQYGSVATAVANPFERVTATFPTTGTTNLTQAYKFRDPFRSWVVNTAITASWAYGLTGWTWQFRPNDGFLPPLILPCTTLSTQAPHGAALFPGLTPAKDICFWWMDQGATLTITILSALFTNANLQEFRLARYDEGAQDYWVPTNVVVSNFGFTTLSAIFTVPSPGYYTLTWKAIGAVGTANATITLAGSAATTPNVWGHRCTPGLVDNWNAATDIRHVASSIMYTNKAAPLYRNGLVTAKQMPKDIDWTDIAFSTVGAYNYISSCKDAYQDEVREGFYGFLKPSETSDLEFFDQIMQLQAPQTYAYRTAFFNLQNDAEFIACCVSVDVNEGKSGIWTVCDGLEYVTNDQWRATAVPTYSYATWSKNMEMVSRAQQFYENKTHWREILLAIQKGFKAAMGGVVKYGPHAINAAKLALALAG